MAPTLMEMSERLGELDSDLQAFLEWKVAPSLQFASERPGHVCDGV